MEFLREDGTGVLRFQTTCCASNLADSTGTNCEDALRTVMEQKVAIEKIVGQELGDGKNFERIVVGIFEGMIPLIQRGTDTETVKLCALACVHAYDKGRKYGY